ncbi:MAG: hypothetical protein V4674_01750 [Patescibacteria group bacterium]
MHHALRTKLVVAAALLGLFCVAPPTFANFQPTSAIGPTDLDQDSGSTPSPNAPTSGTSYSLPTRESPAAASAAPSTAGGSVIKNNCKTSVTDGAGQGTYCFLAPINVPGLDLTKAGISEEGVSDYLRTLFTLFISFGGVVLFFSLVWAGLQYIWGGVGGRIEGVNEARARIRNAGIGTAIALGSFLILRTINPNIVAFKFTIPKIEVRGGATGQARAKDAIRQAKDAVTGGGSKIVRSGTAGEATAYDPTIHKSASAGDDKTVRALLKDGDITVNSTAPKTDVGGMGKTALDKLITLKATCGGCTVQVTGGNEPGHETHRVGRNIVDISLHDKKTVDFITKAALLPGGAVRDVTIGSGPAIEYIQPNGDVYRRERIGTDNDHFHVIFKNP